MFFAGRGQEHKTLRRLVANLEKAKIAYVIVGGMAVNAHRYERTTGDVDVLMTRDGFAEFRRRFVPKSYDPAAGHPRRFLDRRFNCTFHVLITGLFPGSGRPGPIAFTDPGAVAQLIGKAQVVNLPTLIQLKLAAQRLKDHADVVELIRFNNLDESFQARLHPSVRGDFNDLIEEKRRNDAYEARQDRAFEKMQEQESPRGYRPGRKR